MIARRPDRRREEDLSPVTLVPDVHPMPYLAGGAAVAALVGLALGWRGRRRRARPALAVVGRFAFDHPWAVLGAWLALLAVSGWMALPRLAGSLSEGGMFVSGAESNRAHRALAAAFPDRPDQMAFVVFTSGSLTPEDQPYRDFVDLAGARLLRGVPGATSLVKPWDAPHMVGEDGSTSYLVLGIGGEGDEVMEAGRTVNAVVAGLPTGPVRAAATGGAPIMAEAMDAAGEDLSNAETVGLPVAALILVAVFGSLVAAGMPMLVAGAGLVGGFGVVFLLAQVVEVGALVENAATMIGLAVGIDYSLFIVTRYREEVGNGLSRADAAERAMATAGRAVFFSGMTVVVALAGLLLVPVPYMRTVALGPMVVVLFAVVAAETLLPALLGLAGRWVDRLRVPGLKPWKPSLEHGFWVRWSRAIMRRPVLFLLLSAVPLLLLAAPTLRLTLGETGISSMAPEFSTRRGYETLARSFPPGVLGPVDVVVRSRGGVLDLATAEDIDRFTRLALADQAVAGVESYLDVIGEPEVLADPRALAVLAANEQAARAMAYFANVPGDADLTVVTVRPNVPPDDPEAAALVQRLRDDIVPRAFTGEDTTVMVGGGPAEFLDSKDALRGSVVRVYLLIVGVSFLLLMMVFRSILIPLKAIAMNLLSVAAAFGVLVLVFQGGLGVGLLGAERMEYLDLMTPLLIFGTLFGLSMDYEVFLLSRMREEYLRTGDNTSSVAVGLETTGRTISSAALIMVVVFAAFAPSRLVPVSQVGLGLAVAVLLDATVIRIVLVPATMRLLGDRNWWMPRWLDRILPRVHLEGPVSPSRPPRPAPVAPTPAPRTPVPAGAPGRRGP
jgi:RND superfamily putative drug exporter